MLTFREYILCEQARVVNNMAISIEPRNINVAKVELSKLIKSNDAISQNIDRDDLVREIGHLRALYNVESKKFYVWVAYEAVHDEMIGELRLDRDNVHLEIGRRKTRAGPYGILHGPAKNQHPVEDIKRWGDEIQKFVGKVSPLDMEPFIVYGR